MKKIGTSIFFSFSGRAGAANPQPPVRGAGWGKSIGLRGGGSGGQPPKKQPKKEQNNNNNNNGQGTVFSELKVVQRPTSSSVSVTNSPPPHLQKAMHYIKHFIVQRPALTSALRSNNLDLIYPFRGQLYRLQYSLHAKQLSPLPKKSASTQTGQLTPIHTIQLTKAFERQITKRIQQKDNANNPAPHEVVDLVTPQHTPPRGSSAASSPTITLS